MWHYWHYWHFQIKVFDFQVVKARFKVPQSAKSANSYLRSKNTFGIIGIIWHYRNASKALFCNKI